MTLTDEQQQTLENIRRRRAELDREQARIDAERQQMDEVEAGIKASQQPEPKPAP